MILGLIWKRLALSKAFLNTTFWLAVYGTFANLIVVIISAVTGIGKMMPIAGGQEEAGITDGLLPFLLVSLSLSMLAVCGIVLTGFYRHMKLPR